MAEMGDNRRDEKKESLIDSIYRKFVRGVSQAIGSTEFYEFFLDSISCADNEFQFSNRKMIKSVDIKWVEEIENALNAIQNIVYSPRNIIKEEELIVNVAHAKKAGSETVRHLAMHSAMIDDFDKESGDVRPGKLMQRYREDSIGMYENRLVYTTLEYARHFVKVRHDALLEAMSDEFGAKLKVRSDMNCASEHVHMDMFLHIKEMEGILETDAKHGDVLDRISRMNRILIAFMDSDFAQQMAKQPRVAGAINKTNILKKNPDYKVVLRLFEFLKSYQAVGYEIRIIEQNPEINDRFRENIYRNILFNYLILKGYLEDARDRKIPVAGETKEREIKPKVIHQIIEELTEDYDLTDVEVRKVLIEELTREQLMHEEAAERLRLVEEQEAQRTEEEKQKLTAQRQEEERIQKEKEQEELRLNEEKKLRNAQDRRRGQIFRDEVELFKNHLEMQMVLRQDQKEIWNTAREDFADAAAAMEAEKLRRQAMEYLQDYAEELDYFARNLNKRIENRRKTEAQYRQETEAKEQLRREKLAKKTLENRQ